MTDLGQRLEEAQRWCDEGRFAQAEAAAREVLSQRPGDPATSLTLARALIGLARFPEGTEITRRLLDQHPGHPAVAALHFNAMIHLGDADACWRALAAATRFMPDNLELLTNAAGTANCAAGVGPRELYELHAAYGRALERARPGAGPGTVPEPDPERRLRVGVVSYDYRLQSSVSFFLSPIFELLDGRQFEVTAYHTGAARDAGTERFRALAARWRQMPSPPPDALAKQIRDDQIDVVLEINSHTGYRTLPAFSPRCAPVQVSYLGYSNTTGMRSFDWRIVDSLTDPAPVADALATERLWRLDPCFVCYKPGDEAPGLSPAPSVRAGHVTFGAMSELVKLNADLFGLWGEVLRRVPCSRLLLKNRAAEAAPVMTHLRERMERAGVDLSRVDFLARTPAYRAHLETYGRVDIALDTFPYNGTTTICESLLMGVPMIGLRPGAVHDRHAARVGLSVLTNAGLPELIAGDRESYVRLAAELAASPARLAEMRESIRSRFLASTVCDAQVFAERFGVAVREMWRERCRGARR